MKKEYAVYKGDTFLFIGTIEECMKYFNVAKSTVRYWANPANYRIAEKTKNKNTKGRKVAIALWKD